MSKQKDSLTGFAHIYIIIPFHGCNTIFSLSLPVFPILIILLVFFFWKYGNYIFLLFFEWRRAYVGATCVEFSNEMAEVDNRNFGVRICWTEKGVKGFFSYVCVSFDVNFNGCVTYVKRRHLFRYGFFRGFSIKFHNLVVRATAAGLFVKLKSYSSSSDNWFQSNDIYPLCFHWDSVKVHILHILHILLECRG